MLKGGFHVLLNARMGLHFFFFLTKGLDNGSLVSFSIRGGGKILNSNVQIWRRKFQVTRLYEVDYEWTVVTQRMKRQRELGIYILRLVHIPLSPLRECILHKDVPCPKEKELVSGNTVHAPIISERHTMCHPRTALPHWGEHISS